MRKDGSMMVDFLSKLPLPSTLQNKDSKYDKCKYVWNPSLVSNILYLNKRLGLRECFSSILMLGIA